MPYKDPEKRREANRLSQLRYRARHLEKCRERDRQRHERERAPAPCCSACGKVLPDTCHRNSRFCSTICNLQAKAQWERDYRLAHPEHTRAREQAYRDAHRDKRRASQRANRLVHLDKRRQSNREWQKQNPEKRRPISLNYAHRRRVLLRAGRKQYTERVNYEEVYQRDGGRCHICGKKVPRSEASFDHIVPIALGGPHVSTNLRLAHRVCNSRRQHRKPGQPFLL